MIMTTKRRQVGITLIELMVAMMMGGILIFGVVETFVAHKKMHSLQIGLARVQEGGRIAIDMMARDVRMADYWGCAVSGRNVVNNLNYNLLDSDDIDKFDFLLAGGVGGEDNISEQTVGSLAVIAGTDILTLRGSRAGDCVVSAVDTASARIKTTGCDIEKGDIVFISDCLGGDIFQNTASTSSSDLGHDVAGNLLPGNKAGNNSGSHCDVGALKCLSQAYGLGAKIYRPYSVVYFIALNTATGEPGLYKRDSINNISNELVDGVENMQIAYVVDSDYNSAGKINNLAPPLRTAKRMMTAGEIKADASIQWNQVVGLRVDLLLRSDDAATAGVQPIIFDGASVGGDRRMRKIYTTTMNIRNRSIPSAGGL